MRDLIAEKTWESIKPLTVYKPDSADEAIIFNPLSGETHLLNLFALDIIEFLEKPARLSSLNSYLCDLYQAENPESLGQQLGSVITELADLGLIFEICR